MELEDLEAVDQHSKLTPSRICGTDLHKAIANGDFQAFEQLVKDGAPMEIKNCHGLTPLQVVCTKKDAEMVAVLLRAGCQVNAKSSSGGKSALAMAAFVGHMDIFEMLINHGADVDCLDDHGWTTLHEAILGKSDDVVEHINKIRPKMKYKACQSGRTPLHLAAFCDASKPILRSLLNGEEATDLAKHKDENGRSICQMALLHSSCDWGDILGEEHQ